MFVLFNQMYLFVLGLFQPQNAKNTYGLCEPPLFKSLATMSMKSHMH